MSERYTELYRLPSRYCLEGCPLYVEAGTLLKDNENGKVLVQLKICNLSKYKVTSCKVTINSYEPNGNLLETVRHQFMDVDGATGIFFGTREPIYLSENIARKYDVCITEIVFDNDDVWTGTEIKWNEIDDQEKISDYFSDKELVEQFYRETGKQSVYVPRVIGGIYQCACGTLNINPEYKCRSCKQEYSLYDRFLNKEYLKERLDERKEQEFRIAEEKRIREEEEKARKEEEARQREKEAEQRRIEKEEKTKEKKRKAKKIIIIASVAIFVILFVSVGSIFVYREATYKKAQKLLAAGAYDEAQMTFISLGDYKDSNNQSLETIYEKANHCFEIGDYESALSEWSSIKDYSDSSERIKDIELEVKYQDALDMMNSKQYIDAAEIFDSLDDYRDSKDNYSECLSLKKEEDYQYAQTLMNSKKYEEAIEAFKELTVYKDAEKKIEECEELLNGADYNKALSLKDKGDYKESIKIFKQIKGFKDVDEQIVSASYEYGCILLDEKQYTAAVSAFRDSSGYKDADQKMMNAEYGYILAHKDNTDSTTAVFLQDLIKKNYKDAQAIYNSLYKWSAEYMLVEENSNHYVQVRGQGGAPDTKIKVRLKITYTDGSVETTDWGEIEPAYGLNWTGAKFVYDTNKNIKDMKLYDENGNEIELKHWVY